MSLNPYIHCVNQPKMCFIETDILAGGNDGKHNAIKTNYLFVK
jgi:hypothetical protein